MKHISRTINSLFIGLLFVGLCLFPIQLSAQGQDVQAQASTLSSSSLDTSTSIQNVDTLTKAYSGKWQGASTAENTNLVEQVLGSNDLIFVVLTVSLIIWFVLLTFLIRLDKKVSRIERSSKQ